jgi:3-oxoacyl-[acyl-carrier-protein] synthase II
MSVVVTGLGSLCALGENTDALWAAVERGESGIAPIRRFDVAPFDTQFGAMVPCGDNHDDEGQRLVAYGCAAAAEALERASIADRRRVALVLGTSIGTLGTEIHTYSSDIARALELGGLVITLSTACASSTHAIGLGADLVRHGTVDQALVGGVDILGQDVYAGFHRLGLLAKEPCAPFSVQMGTTLGEGAAFMLLEAEELAAARGVKPLAELAGYGLSADAFHDTAPEPFGRGMARAQAAALKDADIDPEAVDYFNAHGTGTAANDAAEWRAIQRVFGDHAEKLPVSSSKSFLGHTQGAAGALEAVVTLMAMAHQVVPPTLHFTKPRPCSPTDPIADTKPRSQKVRYAICSNAGFGGVNAALVFAHTRTTSQPRPRKTRPIGLFGIGVNQDTDRLSQSVPRAERRGLDLSTRLLAGAVITALTDAKLRPRSADSEGTGLFVGQTRVSPESAKAFDKSIRERGLAQLSAPAFTRMVVNSATGVCCRLFGLQGPTVTLTTGPGSGLAALVLGADHLAWHDDVNHLLAAAVDERGEGDRHDNGAACIVLDAQNAAALVRLAAWALAVDLKTAVAQVLMRACRKREEVVTMAVSGPPASAGLQAVVTAVNALRGGEPGPFLITDQGEGAAAAVILELGDGDAT